MEAESFSINDALRAQFATPEIQQPAQDGNIAVVAEQTPFRQPPGTQYAPPEASPPVQEEPKAAPAAADPRMAKVIAQAQQVRAEREALKRDQAEREADLRELAQYRELKARAKEDPVAVAEQFGYKPDEYAAALIDKGAVTPERKKIWEQQQELNELKQWRQSEMQEKKAAREQHAYNQVMHEMKTFAEHAGESFDLIRRSGDYQRVLQKINEHWERTEAMGEPELMPYEQAFELAEQELFDKVYAPMLESPKIKSRVGASNNVVTAPPSPPSAGPAARPPSGTINPRMRGTSAPAQQMSEAQSLEMAGKLLFQQFNRGGR